MLHQQHHYFSHSDTAAASVVSSAVTTDQWVHEANLLKRRCEAAEGDLMASLNALGVCGGRGGDEEGYAEHMGAAGEDNVYDHISALPTAASSSAATQPIVNAYMHALSAHHQRAAQLSAQLVACKRCPARWLAAVKDEVERHLSYDEEQLVLLGGGGDGSAALRESALLIAMTENAIAEEEQRMVGAYERSLKEKDNATKTVVAVKKTAAATAKRASSLVSSTSRGVGVGARRSPSVAAATTAIASSASSPSPLPPRASSSLKKSSSGGGAKHELSPQGLSPSPKVKEQSSSTPPPSSARGRGASSVRIVSSSSSSKGDAEGASSPPTLHHHTASSSSVRRSLSKTLAQEGAKEDTTSLSPPAPKPAVPRLSARAQRSSSASSLPSSSTGGVAGAETSASSLAMNRAVEEYDAFMKQFNSVAHSTCRGGAETAVLRHPSSHHAAFGSSSSRGVLPSSSAVATASPTSLGWSDEDHAVFLRCVLNGNHHGQRLYSNNINNNGPHATTHEKKNSSSTAGDAYEHHGGYEPVGLNGAVPLPSGAFLSDNATATDVMNSLAPAAVNYCRAEVKMNMANYHHEQHEVDGSNGNINNPYLTASAVTNLSAANTANMESVSAVEECLNRLPHMTLADISDHMAHYARYVTLLQAKHFAIEAFKAQRAADKAQEETIAAMRHQQQLAHEQLAAAERERARRLRARHSKRLVEGWRANKADAIRHTAEKVLSLGVAPRANATPLLTEEEEEEGHATHAPPPQQQQGRSMALHHDVTRNVHAAALGEVVPRAPSQQQHCIDDDANGDLHNNCAGNGGGLARHTNIPQHLLTAAAAAAAAGASPPAQNPAVHPFPPHVTEGDQHQHYRALHFAPPPPLPALGHSSTLPSPSLTLSAPFQQKPANPGIFANRAAVDPPQQQQQQQQPAAIVYDPSVYSSDPAPSSPKPPTASREEHCERDEAAAPPVVRHPFFSTPQPAPTAAATTTMTTSQLHHPLAKHSISSSLSHTPTLDELTRLTLQQRFSHVTNEAELKQLLFEYNEAEARRERSLRIQQRQAEINGDVMAYKEAKALAAQRKREEEEAMLRAKGYPVPPRGYRSSSSFASSGVVRSSDASQHRRHGAEEEEESHFDPDNLHHTQRRGINVTAMEESQEEGMSFRRAHSGSSSRRPISSSSSHYHQHHRDPRELAPSAMLKTWARDEAMIKRRRELSALKEAKLKARENRPTPQATIVIRASVGSDLSRLTQPTASFSARQATSQAEHEEDVLKRDERLKAFTAAGTHTHYGIVGWAGGGLAR